MTLSVKTIHVKRRGLTEQPRYPRPRAVGHVTDENHLSVRKDHVQHGNAGVNESVEVLTEYGRQNNATDAAIENVIRGGKWSATVDRYLMPAFD